MYKVTKRFTIEAAHRLKKTATEGCKRIHGHSYKVEVTLQNEVTEGDQMVMDFTEMKRIFQEAVHSKIDHRIFLQKEDHLISRLPAEDVIVTEVQPTAEYLAHWIFIQLMPYLFCLYSVKVWETEDASAEFINEALRCK